MGYREVYIGVVKMAVFVAPDSTNKHSERNTHGHGDSMTELARWGRLSENGLISLVERGTILSRITEQGQ